MQMLQGLFKVAKETTTPQRETTIPSSSNKKESGNKDRRAKSTVIVVFTDCGSNLRLKKGILGCKNFNPFAILRRKDIAKTFFYTTLDLKKLGSFPTDQHCVDSMKIMKKEDIARGLGLGHKKVEDLGHKKVEDLGHKKVEDHAAAHTGNKVSPVTEVALSSSARNSSDQCVELKKIDEVKGDRAKTISKMKELLRWAAAARAHEKGGKYITKKVLQFRNRKLLKAVPDDDQLSNDSPKISFRWELESCSTTTSSAYSALSMCSSARNDHVATLPSLISTPVHDRDASIRRPGSWITTDNEFVVLEL